MSKHIPLPWAADHGCIWTTLQSHRAEWMIADLTMADEGIIHFDEAEATAEFIVRACNSHEDLLDALRDAMAYIMRVAPPGGYVAVEKISAALTKAERT